MISRGGGFACKRHQVGDYVKSARACFAMHILHNAGAILHLDARVSGS